MQNVQRYMVLRRILFPYSGEELLSFKQSVRVLLAWMFFFPMCMTASVLGIALLLSFSLQKILLLVLIALLSGMLLFGSLGLLVISMNNRAVRYRQSKQESSVNNISGGRYGS